MGSVGHIVVLNTLDVVDYQVVLKRLLIRKPCPRSQQDYQGVHHIKCRQEEILVARYFRVAAERQNEKGGSCWPHPISTTRAAVTRLCLQ